MLTFIKSQLASLLSTLTDFALTLACIEYLHVWTPSANVIGNLIGALLYFLFARQWVFQTSYVQIRQQLLKYVIVWIGYMVITFLLLSLLIVLSAIPFLVAKTMIALFMAFTYNYFLQSKYVFTNL